MAAIRSFKGSFVAVLVLPQALWERVVAHCLDGLPMEACGLLAGVERTGGVGPGSIEAGEMGAGEMGAGEVGAGGAGANGERRRHEDLTVAEVCEVYPAANAALSARLYTVEPKDLLRADRAAERAGWSLIGVWHSHTHSPAYPSPTDIAAAPDPLWHYVVVSLSDTEPVLRSYRIVGGQVREEPVLTRGIAARALGW